MTPDDHMNSKHVVLVADDDFTVRYLTRQTLEQEGFQVEEAENGASALSACENLHPDIILLDVVLPDTDGFAVCEKIRSFRGCEHAPVLMMTGLNDVESIRKAYESGATDFITKPVNWLILSHRIRYMLRSGQTLSELHKSEERLARAQHIARLGSWEYSPKTKDLHWSDELYRLFGLNPQQNNITFDKFIKTVHPEDRDKLLYAIRQQIPFREDYRIILPSGEVKTIREEVSFEYDSSGGIEKISGTAQDITERIKILEELRESEEKFRKLAESINAGIYILKGRKFHYVNNYILNATGYSQDEFGKIDFWDIIHPEFRDIVRQRGLERQNGKDIVSRYETKIIAKNGREYWVELTATLIKIAGSPAVIGTVYDITEKKLLMQEIQQTMESFRSLVETTSDWIWEVDENLLYTYASPQVESLLGYRPEEVVGKSPFDFMQTNEAERLLKAIGDVISKHDNIINIENICMHKDGREVILETSGVPIFDSGGTFRGYRGIDRDITERKKMEDEILKMQKLESVSILAGGLAHDFNNLLQGILGYIELAKLQLDFNHSAYSRLAKAAEITEQASEISNRLLTFSKGGAPLKTTLHISGFLHEAVNLSLSGSNLAAEFLLAENLHPVKIDKAQMTQVINNIIANAKESMPGGGLVSVRADNIFITEQDNLPLEKGEYIVIAIEDHGPGIKKEMLKKIFDPYFTTKEMGSDKGRGLGLTICYSIIKKHGGIITVKSEKGAGAVFSIYLPAVEEELFDHLKQSPEFSEIKKKILLMDDDDYVRESAGAMLLELGFDAELSGNGQEVIALYNSAAKAQKKFDLFILDLTVQGGMGGLQTMEKLLNLDPDVNAIVSTGYANDPIMVNYRNYGFRAAISKPYSMKQFAYTLNKVLSKLAISKQD